MSTPQDRYPWMSQPGETPPGYSAFQVYMRQGKDRSLRRVHEEIGTATGLIGRWSRTHNWVERAAAYDSYLVTAAVDGEADELARVRSKHLDVADKLLDHLMDNMRMWKPGFDPSLRWTTAFTAAAKVQQTALTLKETTTRTDEEAIEKIMAVMEKRAEG
jgi:hypothetical protein